MTYFDREFFEIFQEFFFPSVKICLQVKNNQTCSIQLIFWRKASVLRIKYSEGKITVKVARERVSCSKFQRATFIGGSLQKYTIFKLPLRGAQHRCRSVYASTTHIQMYALFRVLGRVPALTLIKYVWQIGILSLVIMNHWEIYRIWKTV